jgi:hypothetical protein
MSASGVMSGIAVVSVGLLGLTAVLGIVVPLVLGLFDRHS